jgi:hypothetical protein
LAHSARRAAATSQPGRYGQLWFAYAGFAQVVDSIKTAGGQPVVLAVADEEAGAAQLEALFTAQREAEWGEFLADCGKYETELAKG